MPPKQGQVRAPPKYGDIDDSDYVHDEIRELGAQAHAALRSRQPTDEAGLLDALREFGPSKESKAMLRRELEAAEQAAATGVYLVYRNVATKNPSLARGATECFRVGPQHKCFCGHTLQQHQAAGQAKHKGRTPPCTGCACPGFQFVPNSPEEIGEGWLSRRKGFDPAAWAPKCRCSHTTAEHRPERSKGCRRCGCPGFEGHFACFVCDGRYEDHETIVETEAERRQQGLTTGDQYKPLANHPEFAEIAFAPDAPAGPAIRGPGPASRGAAKALPAPPQQRQQPPPPRAQPGPSVGVGRGAQGSPFEAPPQNCGNCAAPFKSAQSRFCSMCGAPRK